MGKITKLASPRHQTTLSRGISEFISKATELPLTALPTHLQSFPHTWPFPRGDLYHWIPLLNRFDTILSTITEAYGLTDGPQQRPWGRQVLTSDGNVGEGEDDSLVAEDADRLCTESIVRFTRLLLENCGNRSLYASGATLGQLLNTTSLSLLKETLHLTLRLAQRYNASRQRSATPDGVVLKLLQARYPIELEKIELLAAPFPKSLPASSASPTKPITQPKDSDPGHHSRENPLVKPVFASNLLTILKNDEDVREQWQDFGGAWVSFYDEPDQESPNGATSADSTALSNHSPSARSPLSRRTTDNSDASPRQRRSHALDGSNTVAAPQTEHTRRAGLKVLELSHDVVESKPLWSILNEHVSKIPSKSRFELLTRLRVAKAFTASVVARQDIVAIRLLAIANLANIYSESQLQSKVFKYDAQEIRPLQLPYQLCELIHPPGQGACTIPKGLQTLALLTLESLAKHKQKAVDVCAALNVNVSHGVLFYVVKKFVAESGSEQPQIDPAEALDWREALFSLLIGLVSSTPRTVDSLVSAGLVEILAGHLVLRNEQAEKDHARVLNFLDTFIYQVRNAFQSWVNAKGLDNLSDLVAYEVERAMKLAQSGQGMPLLYKTEVTDYQIPFTQQQTIRALFKFMSHMMSISGGAFDRLLRNLIESSQLLGALKLVISNVAIYGSNIWSSGINILSSFLHNEPTSFAAISEAGMVSALLAAITTNTSHDRSLEMNSDETVTGAEPQKTSPEIHSTNLPNSTSLSKQGIPPVTEAICTVPQIFGAICLNEAGARMLREANVLHNFFENVLQSPQHIIALAASPIDVETSLGSAFDELARHHPDLKSDIIREVTSMIEFAVSKCNEGAEKSFLGGKIWTMSATGQTIILSDSESASDQQDNEAVALLIARSGNTDTGNEEPPDLEMPDAANVATPGLQQESSQSCSFDSVAQVTEQQVEKLAKDAFPILESIDVVSRFLLGFFNNTALCTPFTEEGGIELYLNLVTSPSIPDKFYEQPTFLDVKRVCQILVEQKAHIAIPSIINRTQKSLDELEPFVNHPAYLSQVAPFEAAFGYADRTRTDLRDSSPMNGTKIVKGILTTYSLCLILSHTLACTTGHRANSNTPGSLNLADMYVRLVHTLGNLQSKCVAELVCWQDAKRNLSTASDTQDDTDSKALLAGRAIASGDRIVVELAPDANLEPETSQPGTDAGSQLIDKGNNVEASHASLRESTLSIKNSRIIWPILSRIPHAVAALFSSIGRSILIKRLPADSYHRQNVLVVADQIATTLIDQLTFPDEETDLTLPTVTCWIFIALVKKSMMDSSSTNIERPTSQILTAILHAFKNRGGIARLGQILKIMLKYSTKSNSESDSNDKYLQPRAREAAIGVLKFFSQITSKAIADAHQTIALSSSRAERGRDRPEYFSSSQFLVELRMAVIPSVFEAWNSSQIDKYDPECTRALIEILQNTLDAQGEQNAFKRAEKISVRAPMPRKYWKSRSQDNRRRLVERGIDESLATEALYRCNDSVTLAQEYCTVYRKTSFIRNHLPPGVLAPEDGPSKRSDSQHLLEPAEESAAADSSDTLLTAPDVARLMHGMFDTDFNLSANTQHNVTLEDQSSSSPSGAVASNIVTIDDLDDQRFAIRKTLIERCLEILSTHENFTFELADLIAAGTVKAENKAGMQEEVAETLIQALISLKSDTGYQSQAPRIVSQAHLLGILLQDKSFFEASQTSLLEYLPSLVEFLKIPPSQQPGESLTWMSHILLILERLLAVNVEPHQVEWSQPSEGSDKAPDTAEVPDPLISLEDRRTLLLSVLDILPKIGKDAILGLAAVRVIVILTRDHELAALLGLKKNLQRLFVMIKQLAGIMDERLQSAFMLVLRHVVEDDETIRRIMRSDIQAIFSMRPPRQLDTTHYTRQAFHCILRQPEIFVQVTDEMLTMPSPDRNPNGHILALKKDVSSADQTESNEQIDSKPVPSLGDLNNDDLMDTSTILEKNTPFHMHAPSAENSDGLIHYLLSELMTYKDVDDREAQAPSEERTDCTYTGAADRKGPSGISSAVGQSTSEGTAAKSDIKPCFKPEEHPIYIYRCFILQCLTELLGSYNSTKVDFMTFTRKSDPPATPSKSRSSVLNYLLNTLLPVGTIQHIDDSSLKQRASTSGWAMSVIVSLCARTAEMGPTKPRDVADDEDEPSLALVRKAVVDHMLKAYKDASASSEPLDMKYSRLLAMADLFNRILESKSSTRNVPDRSSLPHKQLSAIMFDKHYVTALTNSIAEVDLSFPNANRVVKYILRPLKLLSHAAMEYRFSSDTTHNPLAQGEDDDDLSSTSSIPDDAHREETPDLFRNSTLGMFEPAREEDTSSGSSNEDEDDEMYDEEYGDDMEYEEDDHIHDGDVVSDDDEDMDGIDATGGMGGEMGMEVEIAVADNSSVSSEDDDDLDDDDEDVTDEDDDDDNEDEDEDEEDDDEVAEHIEMEIEEAVDALGDMASLGEVDEGEWHDEEEEATFEASDRLNPPIDLAATHTISDIESEHDGHFMVANDNNWNTTDQQTGAEVQLDDEDLLDGDSGDDEDEMDEDEFDEEGITYDDPEADEEEETGLPGVFLAGGFDGQRFGLARQLLQHHHHHHHHHHLRRGPGNLSTLMRPHTYERMFMPGFRSGRMNPPSGGNDDGTNPLLHRPASGPPLPQTGRISNRPMLDFLSSDSSVRLNPDDYLSSLLYSQLGQRGPLQIPHGHGTTIHFTLDAPPQLMQDFRTYLANEQGQRGTRDDPYQAVHFSPAHTTERWQEEARLLFGPAFPEKAAKVINSILRLLVPAAMEADKIRRQKQAEKQAEEEEAAKQRILRETAERQEREEREGQREAAARAEAEATRQENAEQLDGEESSGRQTASGEDTANMQGVEAMENATVTVSNGEATAASRPRITTNIRGRELDITDLGIDQTFLEEIPEEMREEVIMQQYAEHRSQANAAGEEPTAIDRDFLNALPADIRDELIQHEARERRENERQEARRRSVAIGAQRGEEMSAMDMLATFGPALHQSVLSDYELDDELLANLPEEIVAQARAFGANRRRHNPNAAQNELGEPPDRPSNEQTNANGNTEQRPKRVVQVLDKAAVATILRLMFIQLHGNAKASAFMILASSSENRQVRNDILSGILSILQDGSLDLTAIERSFAQLTLRAKQTNPQKTPQSSKKALSGQLGNDTTPSLVVGQCLATLSFMTQQRTSLSTFFLTEHEVSLGAAKSKTPRKGKAKDMKAARYPLNALIGLLGRDVVFQNPALMEQLTQLLQTITQPLKALRRKQEDAKNQDTSLFVAEQPASNQVLTPAQVTAVDLQQAENSNADEVIGETSQGSNTEKHLEAKRPRELQPPDVPESHLRLIVNVFTARDCSSTTFRETMALMINLSCIPGARSIFGGELAQQARKLGKSIQADLLQLIEFLKKADTEMEAQGFTLTKFSPSSSDQAKLLRVLTALDYLLDQDVQKSQDGKEGTSMLVEETTSILHRDSAIAPLWQELSACLSVTHHSENYFFNISSILLPLIESLMIICKRVSLGDTVKSSTKEDASSGSSSADELKKVFFTFTDRHKKILNDLVRHNPKLMSGTFSVLVKNPAVLEFDNKRNYFNRKLHHRVPEDRHFHHPPLQLNVRREEVFIDSYKSLHYKKGDEIKYGKFNIRFHNEEGVDAGGVTREWFQVLARQMFNPDYALFNPVASDRTTFHPNALSTINENHLRYFKFIGRIIGKALYEGRVLDCHFSRAVYKRILGKAVSMKDMETIDLDYTKSMQWILENDITDIITETFSIEIDRFGKTEVVDLIENGRNVPVSEENKHDYVRLVVEYRLTGSVQEQLEHFLAGFHDIVPAKLISIFDERELELLISGLPDIDVDDWRNNTDYHQYTTSSAQIQWFWRAVRSFDKEERAKLLQFVTGTGKVPLNGFKELEGMNGYTRFSIHKDYGSKDRLPSSHTCFNQLDLPEYDSYESLRKQLYTAMTTGNEYFGYA